MSKPQHQSIIDKLIKTAVDQPHRFPNLSEQLGINVKKEDKDAKKMWDKLIKEGKR